MTDQTQPEYGIPLLSIQAIHKLRDGLRGFRIVEARLVGDYPAAAAEVIAFLRAEGLNVTFRQLEGMMPPPRHRFVFRYFGHRAELTITPDVDE